MSENNIDRTDKGGQEQATGRKRAFRGWVFTERAFAFGVIAVTLYVMVGSVIFPDWWFSFLWGGSFNWDNVMSALEVLRDLYFPLVIVIVVTPCVAFVMVYVFRTRVFQFVDKFAGRIVLVTLLLLMTTTVVVYHTEKTIYDQQTADLNYLYLRIADNARKLLAASNSPPQIVPPVDYQYIDKNRVDELFSQIEPDLIEKERTVAAEGSVKGKLGVGVGGAVTAEAEAGKSVSSKSSFERATLSTERNCVKLMNYIVDYREPKYYTNSQQWFLGRENAALSSVGMEGNNRAPLDLSKIPLEKQIDDPPSEEDKREAEQKAKQYQLELQKELETLRGYVFIDGEFVGVVDGDTLILTETFSLKPRKVVFRINLAKSQMPEFQKQNKLRLRVFGDTIRPLSKDGYVDVRLIAAY